MQHLHGWRIVIVGTTGSGKTTLAQKVAQRLQVTHVELDALHWQPNWVPTPTQAFQNKVREALNGERWVVDGNYSQVRDIVWGRADTVVFLDYSFWVTLKRLFGRTWRRAFKQEVLWSGNQESVRLSFFSQDSILLWMLKTYRRRRREYPLLFQKPEYSHLSVVHLKSPKETEKWLLGLNNDALSSK